MRKIWRVHMVWGGRHLKIRDVCMDLEPCLEVHNLVVIQLKPPKLGQMTDLKVVFHIVVLIYTFVKISNSTQSPAQFQGGQILKTSNHSNKGTSICKTILSYF